MQWTSGHDTVRANDVLRTEEQLSQYSSSMVSQSPANPSQISLSAYSSMGPPVPPPSRATSRSRGKKRNVIEMDDSASAGVSESSKISSKKSELHPAQLEYYDGQHTSWEVTCGIFFALIHRDVIEETFVSFTTDSFEPLFIEAQDIFAEKNPKCKDKGKYV